MIRFFVYCSFIMLLFSSCAPSYPKETLSDDIQQLVQKETGKKCSVFIFDTTIYLDMEMADLISSNTEIVNKAISDLQSAVFAITRVALSSDANIKIMVISAYDPDYHVALRMFQNIDDVKSYFYQRISRGDYEQRQLLEIEGPETAKNAVINKHFISQEEYVARLIVSQINMLSRTNPFVSALISALNLKFGYIENNVMYFFADKIDNSDTEEILKKMITDEIIKNLKKYKLFSIKSAIILNNGMDILFEISVDGIN